MALGNLISQTDDFQLPAVQQMPNPLPQLQGGLQPLVQSSRMTQEQQLQQKIAAYENPNRPTGFWQKLAHVAGTIGNVAGDIAVPNVMARIPGTQLNNDLRHESNLKELAALQGQDTSEANSAQENVLRGAQTGEATERTEGLRQENETRPSVQSADIAYKNAQATALLHPQAKTEFEAWQAQNPGKPISDWLEAKAENAPDKKGNDFEQYYKQYITDNNLPDSAHNRLMARKAYSEAGQLPLQALVINGSGQAQAIRPGSNVEPGSMTLSGVSTQNAAAGKEATKEQQAAKSVVDEVDTAHQLAKEAAAGNAPADVDLALSFFKTIKGTGSGIRFTQQEQNLIRGSRNTAGDLEGVAQKVIGGGQMFTPEQRNNILRVMDIHAQQAKNHVTGGAGESGPKEGDTKKNSAGDDIVYRGGKWQSK